MPDSATPMAILGYCRNSRLTLGLDLPLDARCQSMSLRLAEGDFTDYEFQVPIFVLTHAVPEKVAQGENEKLSFTFVTDGIESAIEKAKAAAGDKYVTIIGGANTAQQLIRAGLLDEIQIGIVPVLLGEGLRLFEHVGKQIELERMRVIESPGRTDLRFRVVKEKSL